MAGQQSLLELTRENYYHKAESNLLCDADVYYINKKFGLGEGVDKDRLRHNQLMYSILCTDEISLIDWVNKKINGIATTEQCEDLCNVCSETLSETCNWEKIEW